MTVYESSGLFSIYAVRESLEVNKHSTLTFIDYPNNLYQASLKQYEDANGTTYEEIEVKKLYHLEFDYDTVDLLDFVLFDDFIYV